MRISKDMIICAPLLIVSILRGYAQDPLIIDHRHAHLEDLKGIPAEWILKTKDSLHIKYEHTSHGSQLTTGMNNLDAFMGGNGIYLYEKDGVSGILDLEDILKSDLSAGENTWQQATRDYLDDPENQNCNVIMWSWCNILGHDGDKDPGYCSKMEELISEYGPGGTEIIDGNRTISVQFIFMTGHVNGQGEDGETNQINEYIRNHCITHNRILYDFADIESYDPDDNYFLDKYVDDGCKYNKESTGDGNWAIEWITGKTEMESTSDVSHNEPNGGDWYSCGAAHTHPVNANMKAYGAWYLFARLAGWSGTDSAENVLVENISLWTTDDVTTIDTYSGQLQVFADVFPDTADNKTILWEIVNQTGEATIDQAGLVSAVNNGMVRVIATALDGSGVKDSLEISIAGQSTSLDNTIKESPGWYPNPSSGVFILRTNKLNIKSIDVLNLIGNVIYSKKINGRDPVYNLDISTQPSGIYYIRIHTGDKYFISKIVKQ